MILQKNNPLIGRSEITMAAWKLIVGPCLGMNSKLKQNSVWRGREFSLKVVKTYFKSEMSRLKMLLVMYCRQPTMITKSGPKPIPDCHTFTFTGHENLLQSAFELVTANGIHFWKQTITKSFMFPNTHTDSREMFFGENLFILFTVNL